MKTVRNLMRTLCILVLFLFTNCQSDIVTEVQQEEILQKESPFKSTLLSKQDVDSNIRLSDKMRSLETLQRGNLAESTYSEMYNFTIDATIVKFVENVETNVHSYTFTISRENNTSSVLENAVFSYNETIDDYDASLITYHFTELQRQEFLATQHVSSSYQITYEPLAVNLSDVLGEDDSSPCTITYQEFHIPDGSRTSHLYATNGNIQNDCEHEGGNDVSCSTYTNIVINCPPSGSSSGNGTDDNTTDDASTPSTSGGSGDTNTGDATNDDTTNVVTSPITREETIKQSILACINSIAQFNTVDTTTIDPEILEQLSLTLRQWSVIIDSLNENGCSEEAQEEVIEFLENVYVYPYPHCSSFEYAKPPNINIRACAVINLTETFYAYGELDGEVGTITATVNYSLVFFVMPTWMTNGQSATSTAIAVNNAFNLTKNWFLINYEASESEIITYLDFMLIEQMALFAGTKTDIPPFTIPSPAPYVTSLLSTGNCN